MTIQTDSVNKTWESFRELYVDALLRVDEPGAERVVDDARSLGGAREVFVRLMTPAHAHIGELWHAGTINIAQEHASSAIGARLVHRVTRASTERARIGARCLVATPEGELHELGARMVADLLHLDGWEVTYLGASTPASDLASLVAAKKPDVVLLSVTLRESLAAANDCIVALRALENPPKILAGGGAARELTGADATAYDANQGLRAARQLVGASDRDRELERYLQALGARILQQRKERGWSQQELALRAGLDRTYLSGVENGKQNVTLGAVTRVAHALGLTIDEMLGR